MLGVTVFRKGLSPGSTAAARDSFGPEEHGGKPVGWYFVGNTID